MKSIFVEDLTMRSSLWKILTMRSFFMEERVSLRKIEYLYERISIFKKLKRLTERLSVFKNKKS